MNLDLSARLIPIYHVTFDDWMFLMDDKVMINRSYMKKFGFKLGEVTLSFIKK